MSSRKSQKTAVRNTGTKQSSDIRRAISKRVSCCGKSKRIEEEEEKSKEVEEAATRQGKHLFVK